MTIERVVRLRIPRLHAGVAHYKLKCERKRAERWHPNTRNLKKKNTKNKVKSVTFMLQSVARKRTPRKLFNILLIMRI